jgi:hydroxypyruvate isomerase
MRNIAQSVSWWCYVPELLTPEAFVRAVAEAGYPAIDLVPPEYWPLVRAHGLRLSSVRGHESLTVGLNRLEEHGRIEGEIRANLALAQAWGIPNLIVFSGNRNGLSDDAGVESTVKGLARVARAAEDAGVTLIMELLNSKVDHPDYQADRTAWGVEVCKRVGSEHVKLLYDIYHMQIMEGDVIRAIREWHNYFGHYHTAGNPGRNDLDESQELYDPAILHAIAAAGFSGYVAHEFVPKGEPVKALRAAFAQCAPHLAAVASSAAG